MSDNNKLYIGNLIGICLGIGIASTWDLPIWVVVPTDIIAIFGALYIFKVVFTGRA